MSVELQPIAATQVVWDNGGSTAIPYGSMERGVVYRECIRCGIACNSVSLRGMVCLMCRLGQISHDPDGTIEYPTRPVT